MSILTDIHDSMYKGMEEFFYPHIKKVSLNYTMEGCITTVLGNNQYTVRIDGIDYTIPGTEIPTSDYTVGMIVLIEVPNQKLPHKYIKCKKPY